MRRRDFLRMTSAAALGLASARCAGSDEEALLGGPLGPMWGTPGPGEDIALLPAERRPDGVLELFLLGGMSPWDTFYAVPEHGNPQAGGPYAGQQWWCFQKDTRCYWPWSEEFGADHQVFANCAPKTGPGLDALVDHRNVSDMFARCGGGSRPLLQPFGKDAVGKQVNLGPWVYPLRDRPDILARMRIWVVHHVIDSHEGAIPVAMTGHGRGSARMASLGAHVQRFFGDRFGHVHSAPFAYTIYHSKIDVTDNSDAGSSIGMHRASARPLTVRMGSEALHARLQRDSIAGHKSELDALVQHYVRRYQSRMRVPGADGTVRAPALADAAFARVAMENHAVLSQLIEPSLLKVSPGASCTVDAPPIGLTEVKVPVGSDMPDETSAALRLASHLLTHPTQPARFVNVVDAGLYPLVGGLGYDTHGDHVAMSASNLTHAFARLAERINEPGEGDPSKLDLDRHMVLINTEFGRTPYPEFSFETPGSNHWPYGYVIVGIGGPIDEARAGVVGAIGEHAKPVDAMLTSVTPAEHRAAMLLMMGAWPFQPEAFAVGDIRGASSELQAAIMLKERIWGYGT